MTDPTNPSKECALCGCAGAGNHVALEEALRQLEAAEAAAAGATSCGHIGEDSACLECQACERYSRQSSERASERVLGEAQAKLDRLAEAARAVLGPLLEGRAPRDTLQVQLAGVLLGLPVTGDRSGPDELAALRAERDRDLADMRRFQASFMAADHARIDAEKERDRLSRRCAALERLLEQLSPQVHELLHTVRAAIQTEGAL